jgi:hypothetical protein
MTESSEPKSYEMRMLDPQTLHFSYAPEGLVRLEIENERCYLSVEIDRSFPVDEEGHFLSVRNVLNEERPEIGIINDAALLEPDSSKVVQAELYRHYFVPQIQSITFLKEEFGVLNFECNTDRGPREFSVRNPQENLRQISENRMFIIDIDGCRYEIPDLRDLDKKSMTILRDYVDY